MRKIVGFGDSFCQFEHSISNTVVSYTGEMLNIPVLNLGTSGSSITHAMTKFTEYYQGTEYSADDIIIFFITGDTRIYAVDMPPHIGWTPFHYMADSKLYNVPGSVDPISSQWLKKNGKDAAWAIENLYMSNLNYEFVKMLSFLKVFANANISNTIIVLPSIDLGTHPELLKVCTPSKNFFPLLDFPLLTISINEFSDSHILNYATHTMKEKRVNHLSKVNRMILAKLLANIIAIKSTAEYSCDIFKTHIYNSIAEYDNYTE